MSQRSSKPAKVKSSSRRRGTAMKWIVALAVIAAVFLVFKLMQATSPASQPLASVDSTAASVQFMATVENMKTPPGSAPAGMVWIPGGEFSMGAREPLNRQDMVG